MAASECKFQRIAGPSNRLSLKNFTYTWLVLFCIMADVAVFCHVFLGKFHQNMPGEMIHSALCQEGMDLEFPRYSYRTHDDALKHNSFVKFFF